MDDLLIVGAGPTGLMLGCWLAASGVKARIVDPKPGPTPETRAVGVQARTLEFWAMLGIVDRALARGRKGLAADFWVEGRRVAHGEFGEMGAGLSPYPFFFLLGQDQTEELLYERLKELGGEVEWGVAVTEIEGNTATLGDERATFRFILGCDGARSIVRKAAALEFPGGTYDNRFYVADIDATGGVVPGELNIALFKDRFLAFFPLKDENRYRMVGLLDPALDPETATIDDVRPELERLMKTQVQTVRWFSVYRVHHRVVQRFRKGPLFLLGDAAHVHSPVGGQGMNTGLGDAVNLAWKLVEVLKHGSDERLLDSYDAERRPFAETLVQTTDRTFELIVRQTPLARFIRTQVVPYVLPMAFRLGIVRRFTFRTVSQIRITYRKGPLARGPGGGDRLPPLHEPARPDRWQLVTVGAPTPQGEIWCRDRNIDPVSRPGSSAVLLVRHDGYVGVALPSFSAEALDDYLREVTGRPI
jgi:2-polyprenyl-6-methoxyphenol hydroxylase-like FAD-dependent oxidoreductase